MKPWHFIAIILLVSLGVYFNALFNGFVYDDNGLILEDRWIRDVRFVPEIFSSSMWGFDPALALANYYRPLVSIVYMVIYYVAGVSPLAFHMVNVLFHAGVSVLVFVITRQLLTEAAFEPFRNAEMPLSSSGVLWVSFGAAILFVTHPIHTEAVAWIAGLPDLSYSFFSLLSLYLYITSQGSNGWKYVLSVISFALAALCKEPALMLPLILLSYDFAFWLPHTSGGLSESCEGRSALHYLVKRYTPFLFVAASYLGLRVYALGGFAPKESQVTGIGVGYLFNVFPLFTKYLEKLALPAKLNAFHVFHPVLSFFELKAIVAVCAAGAFVFLLVYSYRKYRAIFFGLMMIALPLLPALYIPAVGENVFAERYLYLPSFGFILLIVFLAYSSVKMHRIKPLHAAMFFIALATVYSVGTMARNTVWKNNLTLFGDTVRKSPDAAPAHQNLGLAYYQANHIDEAIAEYKAALMIRPDNPDTHFNLCIAYRKKNLNADAASECEAALIQNPDDAEAHNSLGNAYWELNRLDDAIYEYQAALRLNPYLTEARKSLEICTQQLKIRSPIHRY